MDKTNDAKQMKRDIVNAIKDLDRTDYIDMCVFIKSNSSDHRMVSETPRGTFIDLDQIYNDLLIQLHNIIKTKLHRISGR